MFGRNRYTYINDNTVDVQTAESRPRTIRLMVGQPYIVQSEDSSHVMDKTARCTIVEFNGSQAKVKFLDTQRYDWVNLVDLSTDLPD